MSNTDVINQYINSFIDLLPFPYSSLVRPFALPLLAIVSPTLAFLLPFLTPIATILLRPFMHSTNADPNNTNAISTDLLNAFLVLLITYLSLHIFRFVSSWLYGLVIAVIRLLLLGAAFVFGVCVYYWGLENTLVKLVRFSETLAGGPWDEVMQRYTGQEKMGAWGTERNDGRIRHVEL